MERRWNNVVAKKQMGVLKKKRTGVLSSSISSFILPLFSSRPFISRSVTTESYMCSARIHTFFPRKKKTALYNAGYKVGYRMPPRP